MLNHDNSLGEIIISPAQIPKFLPFQMPKSAPLHPLRCQLSSYPAISSEYRHAVAHEAHEELVPRQGAIVVDVVGFKDTTRFLRCEVGRWGRWRFEEDHWGKIMGLKNRGSSNCEASLGVRCVWNLTLWMLYDAIMIHSLLSKEYSRVHVLRSKGYQ